MRKAGEYPDGDMWRPLDTSIDARQRQLDIYRSMTPGERLTIAMSMSDEVRAIAASGIRARHPDWSPAQCDAELREILRRR